MLVESGVSVTQPISYFLSPDPADFMAPSSLYAITQLFLDGMHIPNTKHKYATQTFQRLLFLNLWFVVSIQNGKPHKHKLTATSAPFNIVAQFCNTMSKLRATLMNLHKYKRYGAPVITSGQVAWFSKVRTSEIAPSSCWSFLIRADVSVLRKHKNAAFVLLIYWTVCKSANFIISLLWPNLDLLYVNPRGSLLKQCFPLLRSGFLKAEPSKKSSFDSNCD